MVAGGARYARRKGGAAETVEEAAGRRTVAGRSGEHNSDGSSEQRVGSPVEEAASGHVGGGHCEAGRAGDRVEDEARLATGDLDSRLGVQEGLLAGQELGGLCTVPGSERCSQPAGLEKVHYSLLRVGTGLACGDCLLGLHVRHRLEEGLGVEDIRIADFAGRNLEGEGPWEVEEEAEGTGTAGSPPSSLDASPPGCVRQFDAVCVWASALTAPWAWSWKERVFGGGQG